MTCKNLIWLQICSHKNIFFVIYPLSHWDSFEGMTVLPLFINIGLGLNGYQLWSLSMMQLYYIFWINLEVLWLWINHTKSCINLLYFYSNSVKKVIDQIRRSSRNNYKLKNEPGKKIVNLNLNLKYSTLHKFEII